MNNLGTLYRVDRPGNTFETLHHFNSVSGGGPDRCPIVASDGNLYGEVSSGGFSSQGGIYRFQLPGNTYTLLRSFTGTAGVTPGKGSNTNGLIEHTGNGLLYGATGTGGTNDTGVIFSIEKDGDPYTVLHHFGTTGLRQPENRLLLASDGFLYGSASLGGAANKGGIYRIATDGSGFAVIHEFADNLDGWTCLRPLIEGNDGYLYGVTFFSSTNSGSVFRLPKSGNGFASLHRFATSRGDGAQPDSPLIETTNGVFHGVASAWGANGPGCIFKIETSLEPPLVKVNGPLVRKFRGSRIVLRGTASDDLGLQSVEYSTGKAFKKAVGTTSWSARIPVKRSAKRVTINVRSFDNDALTSTLTRIRARRVD